MCVDKTLTLTERLVAYWQVADVSNFEFIQNEFSIRNNITILCLLNITNTQPGTPIHGVLARTKVKNDKHFSQILIQIEFWYNLAEK